MDSVMRGMQQAYTEVTQHLGDAGKVGRAAYESQTTKAETLGDSAKAAQKTEVVKSKFGMHAAGIAGAVIGHVLVKLGFVSNDVRTVVKDMVSSGASEEKAKEIVNKMTPADIKNKAGEIRARTATEILNSAIGSSSGSEVAEGSKTSKRGKIDLGGPSSIESKARGGGEQIKWAKEFLAAANKALEAETAKDFKTAIQGQFEKKFEEAPAEIPFEDVSSDATRLNVDADAMQAAKDLSTLLSNEGDGFSLEEAKDYLKQMMGNVQNNYREYLKPAPLGKQ